MRYEVEYVHDHIHSCTKDDEEEAIFYMTIYIHVPKTMKKKLSFEIQSISYED